ncbi:MAG: preprotein translocase subunit SecE [Candidatus Omnitrophica bacterium]|nr:preprotein translocase subunit SecE [Candidatus Omnitrophota bacterium]
MQIFNKTVNFLKEVKVELSKVSWSTRQELIEASWVVIVITSLLALFIGVVDILLSKILSLIFR